MSRRSSCHLFLVASVFVAAFSACGTASAPANDGSGCEAGREGCRCLDGDTCEGAALCREGLCRATETHALHVNDAAARACEVLLREEASEVLDVRFARGTLGSHVRESPRTSLAFMRDEDVAFEGAVATLLTGNGGSLEVAEAHCFDAAGAPLSGEAVQID